MGSITILQEQELQKPSANTPVYHLETERLLFRRIQASDSEALHEIFSSHDAMTYWSHGPFDDISQTINFIAETLSRPGIWDEFAFCLKSPIPNSAPRLIGKIGASEKFVGFCMNPKFWGKGFASEALGVFLKHFWATRPEMDQVQADVDPDNSACLKLLRKHGFEEVGREEHTYNTHMGWCDSVYMGLNRPEV